MEHSQNKGQHFKWSAFSFTEIAMSAFFFSPLAAAMSETGQVLQNTVWGSPSLPLPKEPEPRVKHHPCFSWPLLSHLPLCPLSERGFPLFVG